MDIINRLGADLCQHNTVDWEKVNKVFAEVADYAHFHFVEEEHLMDAKGLDMDY